MEVRGGVIVTATGGVPDKIQFAIATTAGGDSIPVDPTATTNRMVVAYRDASTVANDVPYTADDVIGDGDALLEPGELKLVVINISDINPAPTLVANSRFTLELQTPVGAVIDITRSLPAAIDDVMQLH
jgi:archaellin